MANHLDKTPYLSQLCRLPCASDCEHKTITLNPPVFDNAITNPEIGFVIIVNNYSRLTFILPPLTFLIWAKSRYNFLNTGSGLEHLFYLFLHVFMLN